MENKPAQNIQDSFLNTARKERTSITIYLLSGVKLTGRKGRPQSLLRQQQPQRARNRCPSRTFPAPGQKVRKGSAAGNFA